jgi:hypothetical protein
MGQLYIIKTNKKTKQKTIVTVCSVTDLHVVISITNVTKLEFSNYVDWTDFERYNLTGRLGFCNATNQKRFVNYALV